MLNTMDGVRETDGARIEMARVFGLSRPAVLRRIVAPSALPRIAAGVRVGLPLALVLMVISELTASTEASCTTSAMLPPSSREEPAMSVDKVAMLVSERCTVSLTTGRRSAS